MTKEPLRYGVIGINGVGQHHLRWALRRNDIQLTAIADPAPHCATALPETVRRFPNVQELLAANCVDAVSVCVPHHLLAPIAAECLQAGLHVLTEKPMATRVSEIDRLIDCATMMQRQLAVCFQYRSYATPRKMKQIIESGELGQLRRVLWSWSAFRTQHYYSRAEWRGSWAGAGGGVLINQASHDLDLICWLFGRPLTVTAQMGNQLGRVPLEDIASATIRFASGLMVTFQASINQPQSGSVRHIAGDAGILLIDDVQSLTSNKVDTLRIGRYQCPIDKALTHESHHYQPPIHWRTEQSYYWPWWKRMRGYRRVSTLVWRLLQRPYHYPIRGGHSVVLDNFVAACRGEEELLFSAASARQTVELINAITLAAVTERAVQLPLDPTAYDTLWADLAAGKQRIAG
jgi:predicted dehydrogenase